MKIYSASLTVAAALLLLFKPAQSETDYITVGIVGCSTCYESLDKELTESALLALQQHSASDAIQVDILHRDDKCSPRLAHSVAADLANGGVDFVVGHVCEKAAIAASQIYAENDIVFLSIGVRDPSLTSNSAQNQTVFRLGPRADHEGRWAARAAFHEIGGLAISDKPRFTLVQTSQRDDMPMLDAFEAEWRSLHAEGSHLEASINYSNLVQFDEVTVASHLLYLPASQPSVLFQWLEKMKQHDGNLLVISNGFHSNPLVDNTYRSMFSMDHVEEIEPSNALNGKVYFSAPMEPRMLQSAQSVITLLQEQDVAPSFFALNTYAAAQIISRGISNSHTRNAEHFSQWLKHYPVNTVLGEMRFSKNGDQTSVPVVLYQWLEGHLVPLRIEGPAASCPRGDPTWGPDGADSGGAL